MDATGTPGPGEGLVQANWVEVQVLFGAFIVSLTIGLPSFHPTDWELSGIIALLLEAIVVGAAVRRSRAVERSRASSFA